MRGLLDSQLPIFEQPLQLCLMRVLGCAVMLLAAFRACQRVLLVVIGASRQCRLDPGFVHALHGGAYDSAAGRDCAPNTPSTQVPIVASAEDLMPTVQ